MKRRGNKRKWKDYKREILLTHDDKMVHSATKMRPKQAKKHKDNLQATTNMTTQQPEQELTQKYQRETK